jgi:hypothetical protein
VTCSCPVLPSIQHYLCIILVSGKMIVMKQKVSNKLLWNSAFIIWIWEQGSSVSIVSGYGLDDWAIEVRSRFWGPLSLLYNGYRGSLPWG